MPRLAAIRRAFVRGVRTSPLAVAAMAASASGRARRAFAAEVGGQPIAVPFCRPARPGPLPVVFDRARPVRKVRVGAFLRRTGILR